MTQRTGTKIALIEMRKAWDKQRALSVREEMSLRSSGVSRGLGDLLGDSGMKYRTGGMICGHPNP